VLDQVTDEDISALETEAGAHGDSEQVRICAAAIRGDSAAYLDCARVIVDAREEAEYQRLEDLGVE
jgi:hypothetical protein